jgi:hypothetical protein
VGQNLQVNDKWISWRAGVGSVLKTVWRSGAGKGSRNAGNMSRASKHETRQQSLDDPAGNRHPIGTSVCSSCFACPPPGKALATAARRLADWPGPTRRGKAPTASGGACRTWPAGNGDRQDLQATVMQEAVSIGVQTTWRTDHRGRMQSRWRVLVARACGGGPAAPVPAGNRWTKSTTVTDRRRTVRARAMIGQKLTTRQWIHRSLEVPGCCSAPWGRH